MGGKTKRGVYGERGSASLYGGLGALPPVGSRGKAPSQGVRGRSPPEAIDILTRETPILHYSLVFERYYLTSQCIARCMVFCFCSSTCATEALYFSSVQWLGEHEADQLILEARPYIQTF